MKGRAHPCSTSLYIYFSSASVLRYDFDDLWFPLRSITSRSDFLVASSIGDRRQHKSFWIMFNALSLSSWRLNNLLIPVMSRNFEPWPRGIQFRASIASPKFPSNVARVLMFYSADSCVRLN